MTNPLMRIGIAKVGRSHIDLIAPIKGRNVIRDNLPYLVLKAITGKYHGF